MQARHIVIVERNYYCFNAEKRPITTIMYNTYMDINTSEKVKVELSQLYKTKLVYFKVTSKILIIIFY